MARPQKGVGQGRRSSFDIAGLFSPDSKGAGEDEFKNVEVEEDATTGKASIKDTRSKLLGFGPRLGRDNASRLQSKYNLSDIVANQAQGRAKDLFSFEGDEGLRIAEGMLPINARAGLDKTYGALGIPYSDTQGESAGNLRLAQNATAQQDEQQKLQTGAKLFPNRLTTAMNRGSEDLAYSMAGSRFANSPEGQATYKQGQAGRNLIPAGQAFKLFSTEVGPNSSSFTEPNVARRFGVSPYRSGPTLAEEDSFTTIPDGKGGFMKIHAGTKRTVSPGMSQGAMISPEDAARARAARTPQPQVPPASIPPSPALAQQAQPQSAFPEPASFDRAAGARSATSELFSKEAQLPELIKQLAPYFKESMVSAGPGAPPQKSMQRVEPSEATRRNVSTQGRELENRIRMLRQLLSDYYE